ncbi:enhancer of yellow 2 transcription factor-like [Anopheles nili]|uniref:enhancer of yellow 2 transcription factor-like n=1 Tax=Anopheles nili TaxID=185578 RepID=UPI00237BF4E9|nr:enhancer of yellow 2 transcription factor-like [Anopheles nili]
MYSKSVDQITILHGDRTKLKDLLRLRLIESGWDDQVRLLCRQAIADNGLTNVDSVVQVVTPEARTLIPDVVKKELLQKIRMILIQQEKIDQ